MSEVEVLERPEVVVEVDSVVKSKRGRKAIDFADKKNVVRLLKLFQDDEFAVSAYFLSQLKELGYVDRVQAEHEPGRRGRRPSKFVINGKGRGLLSLSKNWKL